MMTSDARKRLAERTAEQDAHWTHHDPAVRALIAQAEKRGAIEALRSAADEVTEDGGAWDVLALYVDEAGHPYALDGIRHWLRDRADRIATDAQGGDQ